MSRVISVTVLFVPSMVFMVDVVFALNCQSPFYVGHTFVRNVSIVYIRGVKVSFPEVLGPGLRWCMPHPSRTLVPKRSLSKSCIFSSRYSPLFDISPVFRCILRLTLSHQVHQEPRICPFVGYSKDQLLPDSLADPSIPVGHRSGRSRGCGVHVSGRGRWWSWIRYRGVGRWNRVFREGREEVCPE